VLLRYDGRTLVLFNRSQENINIRNLVFVQQTEEGEVEFEVTEWGERGTGNLRVMRPGECYQAWSISWVDLPASEPPADICVVRQGFIQTPRAFWIGLPDATFEVRRGAHVLAVCPTAEEDIEIELRCVVDVRP